MNILNLAKSLIFIGIVIFFVGVLVLLLIKLKVPIGNLLGDIHIKKEKFSFYFPVVSSIIVSIILTILINLFIWIFRK